MGVNFTSTTCSLCGLGQELSESSEATGRADEWCLKKFKDKRQQVRKAELGKLGENISSHPRCSLKGKLYAYLKDRLLFFTTPRKKENDINLTYLY